MGSTLLRDMLHVTFLLTLQRNKEKDCAPVQ